MDGQTSQILSRISRGIPKRLANNLTKTVVDTTEEEFARAALKSPNISKAKKEQVAKLLAKGAFRRAETVVNEEVVKQIDDYNTRQVAKARATGRLKDPMTDPFYRNRMERLARGDFKKADPLSKQEILNARKLLSRKPQP